jgi:hypothetical protein
MVETGARERNNDTTSVTGKSVSRNSERTVKRNVVGEKCLGNDSLTLPHRVMWRYLIQTDSMI